MCALCIGLCGSPNLLGRAAKVKDYVMRGCEHGYVEITLCNGEGRPNSLVQRIIKKSNQSTWRIDGTLCRKEEVQALVAGLGIQVDNLCQFLPQDRVVEFAKMKPDELLVETEKALGDSTLHDLHMQLKEHSLGHDRLKSSVVAKRNELSDSRERLEELAGAVRRNERREKMLEEKSLLLKKEPWLVAEAAVKEYNQHKENYSRGREMYKQMVKSYEEQAKPVFAKEREQAALQKELKTVQGVSERAGQAAARETEAARTALDTAEKAACDAAELRERADSRAREVESKRAEIAELEVQLRERESAKEAAGEAGASAEDQERLEEIAGEIQQVNAQIMDVDKASRGLNTHLKEHARHLNRLGQQLQKMQGAKTKIVKSLVQIQGQDAANVEAAAEWVEANKARFRGEVHGPLVAEIKCSNLNHAGYLENHCPGYLWRSFVTTQAEDRNLLQKELNSDRGWRINTIQYDGDPHAPIQHPDGDARQFAQMGVTNTLDQVFRAPEVIKRVMCDHAAVNKTFVGTDDTQKQIDADAAERREHRWVKSPITTLWTPSHRYSKVTSKYSRGAAYRVEDTRPGRILRSGSGKGDDEAVAIRKDQADHEEQAAELQASLDTLAEKRQGLAQQHSKLTGERNNISKRMKSLNDAVRQTATKLNAAKKHFNNLLKRKSVEEQVQEKEELCTASRAAAVQKSRAAVEELLKATDAFALSLPVLFAESERRAQCHAWSERFNAVKSGLEQAKAASERLKKEAEKKKKSAEALKRTAHETAPLTEALKEKLSSLPDSLEELQDKIDGLDASIRAISADESAVREADELKAKVQDLSEKLDADETTLRDADAKTADLRGRWLPSLRSLVERISVTFGRNFSQISCAGEVRLREPDAVNEQYDYEKYAIEIWVKYRESQDLSLLTATQQSGGERSVATILYLISIQDLTAVPFRVIDEINQGMDPKNERMVFKQLVESSCRPGTPQCFLLTPKLLPELPYHPEISVLNIFNGPYLQDGVQSWDSSQLWHSGSLRDAARGRPIACAPKANRLT